MPRSLFFVDFEESGRFGVISDCPRIKSSKRAKERAKKQYREVDLRGAVEREYLYAAITGSELVPFGHMPYLPIVLPAENKKGKLRVLTALEAKSQAIEGLSKWFTEAEQVWEKIRGKKSNYSMYEWLDFEGKLTGQNLNAKFRVVFPGPSSTYLVSAVLPYGKNSFKVKGVTVPLQGLVIDHALLQYETENEDEAHYLCAFLNAESIDRIIKPFQSTGKGGAQNIHKKPLELPIPKYDARDPFHEELSKLGKKCTMIVRQEIIGIASQYQGVGTIRRLVKHRIAKQLAEIDTIAREILSKAKVQLQHIG